MTATTKAIAILIDMVISPRVGMQISSADLDWPETVFIPCFAASCRFTQTTSPLCDRALRGDKGDGALSVFESKSSSETSAPRPERRLSRTHRDPASKDDGRLLASHHPTLHLVAVLIARYMT
jgi:hypothetical protein